MFILNGKVAMVNKLLDLNRLIKQEKEVFKLRLSSLLRPWQLDF